MNFMFFLYVSLFINTAVACENCIGIKNEKIGFLASSAIPFPKLMEESMHLMDTKMSEVKLSGTPEKVFLEMMLAHHQGAINMAHSLIAHSKDKALVNFARSIISGQYNEVLYMQTLLKSYSK